jgi:hypothetical protein
MTIKVSISFKDSEKYMYDFLQSQSNSSIYIKELIKREMRPIENKISNKKNNNEFNLDF